MIRGHWSNTNKVRFYRSMVVAKKCIIRNVALGRIG